MSVVPVISLRRVVAGIMWWLREVTGEADYDHYVEHARRAHPDLPILTRRAFERARADQREANPRARCC